jgi:hypothetical protein
MFREVVKTTSQISCTYQHPLFHPLFTYTKRDTEQLVTFIIGKGEISKTFIIHKAVACAHSPVLLAAFNGPFIEGQTQTYRLEDTSPSVFPFLVQWMYTQRIKLLTHIEESGESRGSSDPGPGHDEICRKQDTLFVDLWVLGDQLLMDGLQNYIMRQMQRVGHVCGVMAADIYHSIYAQTSSDSPLRRLIVDQCIWMGSGCEELSEYYPHEMLVDLVKKLRKGNVSLEPFIIHRDYDVHREAGQ